VQLAQPAAGIEYLGGEAPLASLQRMDADAKSDSGEHYENNFKQKLVVFRGCVAYINATFCSRQVCTAPIYRNLQ
jgi:hypothetical protein